MRERFNALLREIIASKNKNNIYLDKHTYDHILAEVSEAKLKKSIRAPLVPLEYRRLQRYDIIAVGKENKLISAARPEGSNIKYFVTTDELYDVLHYAHLNIAHGGRERMVKELNDKYKNITIESVVLYLSLCEGCQRKSRGKKRPAMSAGIPEIKAKRKKKTILTKSVNVSDINILNQIECNDLETKIMKDKFNTALSEIMATKNKNNVYMNKFVYEKILKEVAEAKVKKNYKTPLEYRRLQRYDIMTVGKENKLFSPVATEGNSTTIKLFVSTEELFDVIHAAHLNIAHGGRSVMSKEINEKYKNITIEAILLYLSLCEGCKKKRRRKKLILPDPIPAAELNSMVSPICKLEFTDLQAQSMRNRFNAELKLIMSTKNKNNVYMNKELYDQILREVGEAKLKTKCRTSLDYRRLQRYDIRVVRNENKLVTSVENEGDLVKYFVTIEELFDIIHYAHININHGGRGRMVKELSDRYKNITVEAIVLYLNLCETCQQKSKGKKKPRKIESLSGSLNGPEMKQLNDDNPENDSDSDNDNDNECPENEHSACAEDLAALELESTREKFAEEVRGLIAAKNKNNVYLSREAYERMIKEVTEAKVKTKFKTSLDYRRLQRYDIRLKDGVSRLISPMDCDDEVKYFVATEDLFDVIHKAHLNISHGGRTRMVKELGDKYKNVTTEAIMVYLNLCKECETKCRGMKKSPLPESERFNSAISSCQVDLIDLQIQPDNEYNFILNYQDDATKFVILRPLISKTASEVSENLLHIFTLLGAPSLIHSDNGEDFCNKIISELISHWGGIRIVPGRPKPSRAPIERANQDVRNKLSGWMIKHTSTNWSRGLKYVQMSMNREYHDVIKTTPFEALFGSKMRLGAKRANSSGDKTVEVPQVEQIESAESQSTQSKVEPVEQTVVAVPEQRNPLLDTEFADEVKPSTHCENFSNFFEDLEPIIKKAKLTS